ncbi:MAG: LPS assembly lipoprotein LptE [Gallionella sp.]|nr:LPS assembly lipoprotein LptE [Gallionella sp.]
MRLLALLLTLLLSACGFQLRGHAGMPFQSIYLEAASATPLVSELRRNLEANDVTVSNTAENAEVILNIESESQEKQILSLSGAGRVNEYQLYFKVSLRAYDNQAHDWIPAEEMVIRRNYNYDDTQILAKQQEEAMLVQSMRDDMVQQIIRRLSRAKPLPVE